MTQKPKCPECGSGQVYYRRILKEFVCRRCGHTWKAQRGEPTAERVASEETEEAQIK